LARCELTVGEADGDTVDGIKEGVGETVAGSGLGLGVGVTFGVTTLVVPLGVGKATVGGGGTSPSESDGNAVP
jgi:hypothetical protein